MHLPWRSIPMLLDTAIREIRGLIMDENGDN